MDDGFKFLLPFIPEAVRAVTSDPLTEVLEVLWYHVDQMTPANKNVL